MARQIGASRRQRSLYSSTLKEVIYAPFKRPRSHAPARARVSSRGRYVKVSSLREDGVTTNYRRRLSSAPTDGERVRSIEETLSDKPISWTGNGRR